MIAFDRDEIEGTLSTRFAAVVGRCAAQPALRDAGLEWTYQELDRAANLVARLCPVAQGATPVLLLLGHGALEIVALLAVLKSGRAWVALDPRSPPARLAAIAVDSGADVVLTCRHHAHLCTDLSERVEILPAASTLLAAVRDPDLSAACDQAPKAAIGPDDLASIVYTSGSTGAPKGVMRSQRSALHRCWLFQSDQRIAPGERIAHLFSCGFVAAEVDVYGALMNGATLCCYPTHELGFSGLLSWLAVERIALLHPPPALWRQVLTTLDEAPDLPALRTLFLAGEALYKRDVERMRFLLPGCAIVHRLSSSEASLMAQFTIPPGATVEDEVVPAGWPVSDKTLRVITPDGREAALGEAGEIVVQSRYLAPGYWRQPELTASRFIDVPEEGQAGDSPMRRYRTGDLGRFDSQGRLHHLGRLDEQVKVRGYRVEPRAVEAALLGLDGIEAVAVVARPGADGENSLVACIIATSGAKRDTGKLRARLAEVLADYMIPSRFEYRDALPLTANGKIDRVALSTPDVSNSDRETDPPMAGTEERVAAIWREILRLDQVSRDDDFFTVGGQSLLAAMLITRLNSEFGLALPPTSVYRAPTIAKQAELIVRWNATGMTTAGHGMAIV